MSERRRVGGAVVAATVVVLVLLGAAPISRERLLAAYVLVLAAIALASLTRIAQPDKLQPASRFELALARRREAPTRPPELVRTERELTLGTASAAHAHRRLLPLLRDAAAARLVAWHGVELDRQPAAARALLGDEAWELLRPDRPDPADPHGPGVPRSSVEALVERIEQL